MGPIYLKLERGTRDVDLSDLLPGVKLVVERLDSTQLAAARERALKSVKALSDGMTALAVYGLDQTDATGATVNLADPDQMARIGALIGAVEVCVDGVKSWNITLDKDATEPAPITREALAVLLMDDKVQNRIMAEIHAAARILVAEGKGFGASRNGSSTEGKTA